MEIILIKTMYTTQPLSPEAARTKKLFAEEMLKNNL
jgi:hypothetical protein